MRTSPQFRTLLVIVFASLQECLFSQERNDACAGVPTSVSWIPSWLHIRSRLAASLWGGFPLTTPDIAGFAPLTVKHKNPACRLGSLSLRLATQLRRLELVTVGYHPQDRNAVDLRRSILNVSHLSADWRELQREGFDNVIQSGWPAFELLRRIQKLVLPERDTLRRQPHLYGRCEAIMELAEEEWIGNFSRDLEMLPMDGLGQHADIFHEMFFELPRYQLEICPLVWAVHYFLVSANTYRRSTMVKVWYPNGVPEVTSDNDYGTWFRIFLKKGASYSRHFENVFFSTWPVLDILGQFSYTTILYGFNYSYVAPFYDNLADLSDQEGPPAVIEAGAHDGTDAVLMGKLFQNTHIWAFEANPHVFLKLQANVRTCGKNCSLVRTTECALGSADNGTVSFYVNNVDSDSPWGADSSSSLFKPLRNGSRYTQFHGEPVDVRLVKLETFAKEVGMGPVRYMELDAEGGEFDILRGAMGLLPKVHAFKLETHFGVTNSRLSGVALFSELKAWIMNMGFRMIGRSSSDAMFVRRDLALL